MNLLISKIHYTVFGMDSQFLIMLEHKYSHCFFAHRISHHFTHSWTQAIDIARQVQNISRQCMSVQANSQVLYYTSVSTGYVSCILADSLAFVLSFFCFSHFLIQEIYYLAILSSNGHRKVLLIFLVAQNSSLKRQTLHGKIVILKNAFTVFSNMIPFAVLPHFILFQFTIYFNIYTRVK